MTEIPPSQLHALAAFFVAVLAVLFISGKVFGKFLDDWWDRSAKPKNGNGNGDVRKLCALGEERAERIVERIDERHARLREIVHENHAAVLAILTRLTQTLESRQQTEADIAATLKLIERHLLDGRRG